MAMNTHKILSEHGYAALGKDKYAPIARYAAELNKQEKMTESKLLKMVAAKFGVPTMKQMRTSPLSFPVWGEVGTDIQPNAVQQMNQVMMLPVAVQGAMMPDAHSGYAMPIGGVAALHNAVSPSMVGFDIACRVCTTILDITVADFLEVRQALAHKMLGVSGFGVGAEFDGTQRRSHAVLDDPLWNELKHLKQYRALAWKQLGSSGGGNHFFDALIGTTLENKQWFPKAKGEDFVAIMTHSGSRKVGYNMASHYVRLAKKETSQIARKVPNGYEWLDTTKDAGREYLLVMELMGKYAQANHDLIHELFLKAAGLKGLATFENHHNFAWIDGGDTVIHRKGATPAGLGEIGIIPGSSGTNSYIVEGLGNQDSLNSSSHGAGRPFSRTEAKDKHDPEFFNNWMDEMDILYHGVAPDEALTAYKDIDRIMELQSDLVRPVAKMKPRIVIMGGDERYTNFE